MPSLPLDDARLFEIVSSYAEASHRITRLLDRIAVATGPTRFAAFQELQAILAELEAETELWANSVIPEFVDEADAQAKSDISALGLLIPFEGMIAVESVNALVRSVTGTLQKGRESVELLSTRVLRTTALESGFPTLAATAQRELLRTSEAEVTVEAIRARVASLLSEQLDGGVVTLIGKDGRKFRFPLDFYTGMVVQNARSQAQSMVALMRAREAQHDLVQVSPNPSKTGDWCDAYRGRVFSVSGGDHRFPPLAATPHGGPPFHPWCRHFLTIFNAEGRSGKQLAQLGNVPEKFLMRPTETNPNRIAREWRASG